jgi:hypothetical protein
MKEPEVGQKILFGQPLAEIPPNPPLKKGGRGDFWQARGTRDNPRYRCGSVNPGIVPENPLNTYFSNKTEN